MHVVGQDRTAMGAAAAGDGPVVAADHLILLAVRCELRHGALAQVQLCRARHVRIGQPAAVEGCVASAAAGIEPIEQAVPCPFAQPCAFEATVETVSLQHEEHLADDQQRIDRIPGQWLGP